MQFYDQRSEKTFVVESSSNWFLYLYTYNIFLSLFLSFFQLFHLLNGSFVMQLDRRKENYNFGRKVFSHLNALRSRLWMNWLLVAVGRNCWIFSTSKTLHEDDRSRENCRFTLFFFFSYLFSPKLIFCGTKFLLSNTQKWEEIAEISFFARF